MMPARALSKNQVPVLRGQIDEVSAAGTVKGWCWSPDEPSSRRSVTVLVDGVPAAQAICQEPRANLPKDIGGDGRHGFTAEVPAALRHPGWKSLVTAVDDASGQSFGLGCFVVWEAAPNPVLTKLVGYVDLVSTEGKIMGWCWDPSAPERRIHLEILVDGEPVGRVVAGTYRPDLESAGIGDGNHGFFFVLPWSSIGKKARALISIREVSTGLPLGEPVLLRRRAIEEAEDRLSALEQQVQLLRADLAKASRHANGDADAQAAQDLFRTIGSFFLELADSPSPASGALIKLGAVLDDITARHSPITLRVPEKPLATVCISAEGSFEQIYQCLQSLHRSGADSDADIRIIDKVGFAELALLPVVVRNVHYMRLLPGESINDAIRDLTTDFVAFLSPSLRVAEGWLSRLLRTFEKEPKAGAVGSLILREDDRIEHCGIQFEGDGHLMPIARGAEACELDGTKPVDSIGPLSFVLRRTALKAVGGFDAEYRTGAAAVVDLSAKLRRRNYDILTQPLSRATIVSNAFNGLPDPISLGSDAVRLNNILFLESHI
jgi:O-antigen biosynthesis protein